MNVHNDWILMIHDTTKINKPPVQYHKYLAQAPLPTSICSAQTSKRSIHRPASASPTQKKPGAFIDARPGIPGDIELQESGYFGIKVTLGKREGTRLTGIRSLVSPTYTREHCKYGCCKGRAGKRLVFIDFCNKHNFIYWI